MTPTEQLLDILNRIEHHAPEIFIREKVNGVVGNYALSDLPTPLALHHVCRWIRKAVQPMMTDSAERPAARARCRKQRANRKAMKVYLAQIKCPRGHCVVAMAHEYETDEEAVVLTDMVWKEFQNAVDKDILRNECGLCHATELHVELGRTKFDDLETAMPVLTLAEIAQAFTQVCVKRHESN